MPRKIKEWSPHKYLVAAARKTWRWSPARRLVLARANKEKGLWECEICHKPVAKVEYTTKRGRVRKKVDGAIDHIEPIGKQPQAWTDYKKWYERLFCDKENLQFACTACHALKTASERKARKGTK